MASSSAAYGAKCAGADRFPQCFSAIRDSLKLEQRRGIEESNVSITVAHITPLISLLAGVLILIVPALLNYIVAIYLIVAGVIGLNEIYHFLS
jgi:hypothetical protein